MKPIPAIAISLIQAPRASSAQLSFAHAVQGKQRFRRELSLPLDLSSLARDRCAAHDTLVGIAGA